LLVAMIVVALAIMLFMPRPTPSSVLDVASAEAAQEGVAP
jgi:hypothetical protein